VTGSVSMVGAGLASAVFPSPNGGRGASLVVSRCPNGSSDTSEVALGSGAAPKSPKSSSSSAASTGSTEGVLVGLGMASIAPKEGSGACSTSRCPKGSASPFRPKLSCSVLGALSTLPAN